MLLVKAFFKVTKFPALWAWFSFFLACVCVCVCVAQGASPAIQTSNGTLTMKIAGASLTLSSDTSCAAGSGASAGMLATMADLSAAAGSLQAQFGVLQSTVIPLAVNMTTSVVTAQQTQIDQVRSTAQSASARVDTVNSNLSSALATLAARVTTTAALQGSVDAPALSAAFAAYQTSAGSDLAAVRLAINATVDPVRVTVSAANARIDVASTGQAGLEASITALSTRVASTTAAQTQTAADLAALSQAVATTQAASSANVSVLGASMLTTSSNITTMATRLAVLESQATAASTRLSSLEARAGATDQTLNRTLACLNAGNMVDASGRCFAVTANSSSAFSSFCVCPAINRVRISCIVNNNQSAQINCDSGFSLLGTPPLCTNGAWVGPFPTCAGLPAWTATPSGSVFHIYDIERAAVKTIQLAAAEPDGSAITYAITLGTLPAGLTLSSAGVISGTSAAVTVSSQFSFSVRATVASTGLSVLGQFVIVRQPPVKVLFPFSAADQYWVVPQLLTRFGAKLWAAGGGCQELDSSGYGGGSGGFTTGVFSLNSLSVLTVVVGAGGLSGQTLGNGGGGAGGGLAGIFTDTTPVLDTDRARAVAIAGGGGGESDYNNEFGGAGGGSSGGGGQSAEPGCATGGSQTAPGGPLSPMPTTMRGRDTAPPSVAGGTMVTQYGFGGRSWQGSAEVANGAGGAGYYGGGSTTSGNYQSGGGGSGYVNPTFAVGSTGQTYAGATNGVPNNIALNDPDYPGGTVSYGGRQAIAQGQNGFNGYAVIFY